MSQIWWPVRWSRLPVGSSANSTRGLCQMAAAEPGTPSRSLRSNSTSEAVAVAANVPLPKSTVKKSRPGNQ
ncbi:MAG: hypothetical protein WDW38_001656 [Sanguina aurantia]